MPLYHTYTDFQSQLFQPPKRIVSLVPSQTEFLYDLGLSNEVVGITKFCTHPAHWFQHKTRVGGTKQINKSIIEQRSPDLIIANKEENIKGDIEWLAEKYPVLVTDIKNLEDALEMMLSIGSIVGRSNQASTLHAQIKQLFQQLSNALPLNYAPVTAAYLIWKDPIMCAGGDTFINNMLHHCGIRNVFEDLRRYPEISFAQLQQTKPQFLLLSSEPFPFQQKHMEVFQQQLPDTTILLADGAMFSWYGSRLLQAAPYFQQLRQIMGIPPETSI